MFSISGHKHQGSSANTFLKSSGKSKEVEALIGSLTVHEDKDDSTKHIRTIDDIKIGDS